MSLSTSTEGKTTAGDTYSIICTVTKPAGLLADPDIAWIGPSGTEISSNTQTENSTVISVTATLGPLLASHSGEYTCEMTLASPSLVVPMILSSVVTVTVQGTY